MQKSCIWLNKVGCKINDNEIFTLSLSSVFSQTIKTICYFSSLSRNLWNHTPKASCQLSKSSDTSCSSNWICLPCFISFSSTRNKPKGHSKANKKSTSAYFLPSEEWICFNKTTENKLKTAKLAPSSFHVKGRQIHILTKKKCTSKPPYPISPHPSIHIESHQSLALSVEYFWCIFFFFRRVTVEQNPAYSRSIKLEFLFVCVSGWNFLPKNHKKRRHKLVRPNKRKISNGWAAFRFAR